MNFYTKTQLGLADFRVRSLEAVERYMVAVHLAWAYVEERFAGTRSAQIRCYSDVVRRHRDDHAAAWLKAAVEQVKTKPAAQGGLAPVYGMAATIPFRGMVSELLKRYIDVLYKV